MGGWGAPRISGWYVGNLFHVQLLRLVFPLASSELLVFVCASDFHWSVFNISLLVSTTDDEFIR